MTFTLSAPLELLSLNQAYKNLRNGRRALSKDYVQFKKSINLLMSFKQKEFEIFNDSYDPHLHEIHAHLSFKTPNLYTKAGTISKTSADIANLEKPLSDCVLGGKIDDSQITFWIMRKEYAPNYSFTLQYKIVPRDQ